MKGTNGTSESRDVEKARKTMVETATSIKIRMGRIMDKLEAGTMTPNVANAICNATGKILRTVELERRAGAL